MYLKGNTKSETGQDVVQLVSVWNGALYYRMQPAECSCI